MTGPSPAHRTGTGHLPHARATSWGCTCGAAHIGTYGPTVTPEYAMRMAAAKARTHRRTAALAQDLEAPDATA